MDEAYAFLWVFEIVAAIIASGAVGWAAYISATVNRLSSDISGLKASISANDSTREKLWNELGRRFDDLNKRLDRIDERMMNRYSDEDGC